MMQKFTLSILTSCLLIPTTLGCGGDDEPAERDDRQEEKEENNASKTPTNNSTPGDNSASSNSSTPGNSSTPALDNKASNSTDQPTPSAPISWAGTWFAEVEYTVTCSNPTHGSDTQTLSGSWSIVLTGANGSLEADVNRTHQMIGAGNDSRLTLSGTFPLKGTRQDKTSPNIMRRNEISLKLDMLQDHDNVSGSISGNYETDDFIHNNCQIDSGSVTMSR